MQNLSIGHNYSCFIRYQNASNEWIRTCNQNKELQPKVKVILMSAFEINDKEFSRMLPSVEIDIISTRINERSRKIYRKHYKTKRLIEAGI